MKTSEAIKISSIVVVPIVALLVAFYFFIFLPSSNTNNPDTIGNTLKCNELYELKKTKYWGNEIGQSKAIYNKQLNACLALNIFNNFNTKEYFATIMDMTDDSILLHYSSSPQGFYVDGVNRVTCKENYIYFEFVQNGKKIEEHGCDIDENGKLTDKFEIFDKMFKKVRDFDFKIFDGFSSE